MQLDNEFQPIRMWAYQRGLLAKGDAKSQTIKLMEEVGELAKAVLEKNLPEVKDAIGDCCVVLTSLAHFHNLRIEECINEAYSVIAGRTGEMRDGTFFKDGKDKV